MDASRVTFQGNKFNYEWCVSFFYLSTSGLRLADKPLRVGFLAVPLPRKISCFVNAIIWHHLSPKSELCWKLWLYNCLSIALKHLLLCTVVLLKKRPRLRSRSRLLLRLRLQHSSLLQMVLWHCDVGGVYNRYAYYYGESTQAIGQCKTLLLLIMFHILFARNDVDSGSLHDQV